MSPGFKTALLLIMIFGAPALAQGLDDKALHARDAAPNMPRTQDTIPDRVRTGDPTTTGSTKAPGDLGGRPGSRDGEPRTHVRKRSTVRRQMI
jgi:hypothetical protein